jgi:LysM repeat protein
MTQSRIVLTRRGKRVLVAAIVLMVLLVGAFFVALSPAVGAAGSNSAVKTEIVVIQTGQTLWELAKSTQPERDPRDVVSDIYALNNLESGSQVYVGQVLHIPTSN